MSDLELRLRDELDDLANRTQVPGSAPAHVLGRVRRRRRTRTAGGVLGGAAALVAVLSFAAGVTATNDDSEVVVAAPGVEPLELGDPGDIEFTVNELPEAPLEGRSDPSGVWTGSEFIVWGGSSGTKVDGSVYADGAAYSPADDSWRSIAPAPLAARSRHAAAWTGREMIVWGGTERRHGIGGLLDGAAYDPATDEWRPIAPAPVGSDRSYARTAVVGDLVVFAGGTGPTTNLGASTVLVYDTAGDTWTEYESSVDVFAVTSLGSDLVLAGGRAAGPYLMQFVRFDPRSGAERPLPAFPVQDSAQWVGLASSDGHLLAAVTTMEGTTVAVLDQASGKWTAESTVDTADFTAGLGVAFPFAPSLDEWAGDWYFAWPASGLNAIAPGTSKTVRPSADPPCNANGAVAWTGDAILQWGGDVCRARSVTPYSTTGVEITPVAD